MMTLLRRFVVVTALLFWQGGFLFYASVVVPIGQQLTSHLRQGFITQQVTDYLNLAGAVALVPLAWDTIASSDPALRRRVLRWACWTGMTLALALLAWLHPRLDELLDRPSMDIADRTLFRERHRLYLWISTIQWGLGVAYSILMLVAWRAEDRQGMGKDAAALGEAEICER